MRVLILVLAASLLVSCGENEAKQKAPESSQPKAALAENQHTAGYSATRNAYFGDLHVHTMYSFDAFIFGTTASPDEAYEFAKGGAMRHPGGFDMQLKDPLDFYSVTDHGFYLGALRSMAQPGTRLSRHEVAEGMDKLTESNRRAQFNKILQFLQSSRSGEILDQAVFKDAWDDVKAAANRHNEPGKFTTFIGYEFTSSLSAFENLHRNVIFEGGTAPELPFTRLESLNPEDLWAWMDTQRGRGFESLAIPHNANGSNGEMFRLQDLDGVPIGADYAERRMRNEPLVEISQIKGTSDTHPALSPFDEWADFEIMPYRIATSLPSDINGSYVRQALGRGIALQESSGFNPFKFGVIGSSDTHNASYAGDEDNYWSKVGVTDDNPVERGSVPLAEPNEDGSAYAKTTYHTWSAAGLAGVWAEENTREAIYAAFRRKETFGTSGTRIKVRFFAGYNMPPVTDDNLLVNAYRQGVAMGGDLVAKNEAPPSFLVWAARDARSASLQRLQVIKTVLKEGSPVETVYDVVCSDNGKIDPVTHRCPDNNARVNLSDCSITANKGAAELKTLWQDPAFNAAERAVYYVRVLENPTCRWSTWDALRAGVPPRPDLHATLQERAWSSPIWVSPAVPAPQ